jgi:uncharacterized protein YprB with RNaseH-like and TPR domain
VGRQDEIYLDIETNWDREITVLGFSSSATGLVQLVGAEVTRARLVRALPKSGMLFTYNGHAFDLSVIRNQLGIDLRSAYESHDLRWVCQGAGLTGGQKAVERKFGLKRTLDGYDGSDALSLWSAYERGDEEALGTLLLYNKEDIGGIAAIRKALKKKKLWDV